MDSVPLENFQDVETDPSSNCLSTPVVLRQIMEHLSNTDLLNCCSFVNKLWNYEARSVLRDRACLMAHLKSGHPCKDLPTLASHLQTMNVVPFSGAHFVMAFHDECRPCSTRGLDPSYKSILSRLPWKSLSVKLHKNGDIQATCPGFHLVKSILQNHCETLEEFSLHLESKGGQLFIQGAVENRRFPCLKVLKIHNHWSSLDKAATNFIKALVSQSPKLEELHQEKSIDFTENVLEGSSAVLVTNYEFNPLYHQFSESIIGSLRLKQMRLQNSYQHFTAERFNRVMPMLLQASRTTLNSLYIDDVFLVPLMCYGICLESVTKLEICSKYNDLGHLRPNVFTLLKEFDFTRIFPRVNGIQMYSDPGSISLRNVGVFLEQGNALWREPTPDRAANIKHLDLTAPHSDYSELFCAKIFRDIESLTVLAFWGPQVAYGWIWETWENLRELKVVKPGRTWQGNLDSVFCGIFPEEVALLREKDDEFLQAVNIVPVMPSITCMKKLRTFKIRNTAGFFSERTDRTFIFSKVTGIIAFARCPNLSVTLATNSNKFEKALGHMKPYVDVVLVED